MAESVAQLIHSIQQASFIFFIFSFFVYFFIFVFVCICFFLFFSCITRPFPHPKPNNLFPFSCVFFCSSSSSLRSKHFHEKCLCNAARLWIRIFTAAWRNILTLGIKFIACDPCWKSDFVRVKRHCSLWWRILWSWVLVTAPQPISVLILSLRFTLSLRFYLYSGISTCTRASPCKYKRVSVWRGVTLALLKVFHTHTHLIIVSVV